MRRGPEVCTLRGRIRKCKIKCLPGSCHNHLICKNYPISTQTLFSRNGIPLHILESELIDEGWILKSENLMELLMDEKNLSRGKLPIRHKNVTYVINHDPSIGVIELDQNTD